MKARKKRQRLPPWCSVCEDPFEEATQGLAMEITTEDGRHYKIHLRCLFRWAEQVDLPRGERAELGLLWKQYKEIEAQRRLKWRNEE